MSCDHRSCGIAEKVWLPYTFRDRKCGLKPHSFCIKCGSIKNLSSEKPRDIGYYINVVSDLGKRIKISQSQVRLIAQELDRLEIGDKYTIDRYTQEQLFIKIAKKYLNVSEQLIKSAL